MSFRVTTALFTSHVARTGDLLARELRSGHERAPGLVLVFASPNFELGEVLGQVAGSLPEAVCLGATTAGEFTERRVAKGAVCAVAISGDLQVSAGLGHGLRQDPSQALQAALPAPPPGAAELTHRTAIMLLDPLSGRGEEAALMAGSALGSDVPLVGGAAGDDLAMKSTSVGLGAEVSSDAVVLAVLHTRQSLGIGVQHGHLPISKPLIVTRARDNVVFEVDGRPAWDAWVDMTRARANELGIDPTRLSDAEIGAYLLRFEAGLSTGSEYKIRAPLSRASDGSLSFACGIAEGAEIVITESSAARQIESARGAARRARANLGTRGVSGAVVFDCICRNLILGKEFDTAVRAMSHELGNAPLAGFETYGEIAMAQGDFSGFHNTTTVVLAFPD